MGIDRTGTKVGPSSLEGLGAENSVFEFILSNLSYNLHSFIWESAHLGKNSLLKMASVRWKITFSCIWHIKQ